MERILADLQNIILGLDRALTMLAEADHRVDGSISAAHRGGFTAVIGQLRGVQDAIRNARASLADTRDTVVATTEPITAAPKELSAAQVIALLTPTTARIDTVRNDLAATQARLPDIIGRVAAAANENPAIGILDTVAQILAILLERSATARQNIDAGITDAHRAQSGEA